MSFFTPIDGSVVLRYRGRFSEAKLFQCDGEIFAKHGAGYIRLKRESYTSMQGVLWTKIDTTADRTFERVSGNMVLDPIPALMEILAA